MERTIANGARRFGKPSEPMASTARGQAPRRVIAWLEPRGSLRVGQHVHREADVKGDVREKAPIDAVQADLRQVKGGIVRKPCPVDDRQGLGDVSRVARFEDAL